MADFAYSTPYVPGQSDDTQFVDRIIIPILGEQRDQHEFKLRRLLFESYAVATEEIRSKGGRTGVDPPRRMPDRERESRLETLRNRLPGLPSYNLYEPANALVDMAADMLETGWKYIPWSKCMSKRHELQGIRKMKEFKPDPTGTLKEVVRMDMGSINVEMNSDLKIVQLLQRRGIALHRDHDKIVQLLVEELQRDQPTGYSPLSIEQLQRADREIWSLIGKETAKTGIQQDFEGKFPAGLAVQTVINHPTVRMLLLPLPSLPGPSRPASATETTKSEHDKPQTPAPKQSRKRARPTQPKPMARKEMRAPSSLGGMAVTPEGSRICFGFNDGSCQAKGPGCGRGKHVCTKCYGPHPSTQCSKTFQ